MSHTYNFFCQQAFAREFKFHHAKKKVDVHTFHHGVDQARERGMIRALKTLKEKVGQYHCNVFIIIIYLFLIILMPLKE